MRSLSFAVTLVAATAIVACDDGPNQPYPVASADAGALWNNGNTPPAVDDASAPFTVIGGGMNRQEICPGGTLAQRWAVMDQQTVSPPRHAAGLDLAGDDTWIGLTIDQAEQINCQATNAGDQFGDGNQVDFWGGQQEVWAEYSVQTRKIDQITLWAGYNGTMNFTSLDGMHHYQIGVNIPVTKDGMMFSIDWNSSNFIDETDELYRALMATYAPALPQDPASARCLGTGHCIRGDFGDVAYWYVPALGWALWVESISAAQPEPSTPNRLDMSAAKVLPFSLASVSLQLGPNGPTANSGNLGQNTTACTLGFGLTYGNFLSQCVQVTGNMATDTQSLNMLLGGISHSTERFAFDVQGVDLNFTDMALTPNTIIADADRPHSGDIATEFDVDQSTLGNFANDFDSTGTIQDLHGTAAVYREYMRLVQAALVPLLPGGAAAYVPANCLNGGTATNCTGFEGFVTPANPIAAGDVNNIGVAAVEAINPQFQLGLKLGHQAVAFCEDANGITTGPGAGYQLCNSGDTFSTSFAQVLQVFGQGNLSNMPPDMRDVRFFWKIWVTAFIRHLMNPTVADLSTIPMSQLHQDDLFFDSVGAGQFEIAEYVDRSSASPTQPPTDINITADVKNGIFDEYDFSRTMYRGETALYTAVLENQSDGIGEERSALLTNIFGSPIISGGWSNVGSGSGPDGATAYECATYVALPNSGHANADLPSICGLQHPPIDDTGALVLNEDGVPLLQPYPGAFGATSFTLGPTNVTVTNPQSAIQQATITVPLFTNPYDPSSMQLPNGTWLVPWAPKQPGIGFPVALSGSLDKFIETSQIDLSGTTISANVDYDFVTNPSTGQPTTQLTFLAVETTDFLGEVFLCQDPNTGDILPVRMYTAVADILAWFDAHPGIYDACGIIIRYSPFDNFPDFITSLTNGVRLSVTQGGGFGRVVDATLFVPGQ